MVSSTKISSNTTIKSASGIFLSIKNAGDHAKFNNNWMVKNIYPQLLSLPFAVTNSKKEIKIVIYKKAHAGANIQFGGANEGFIKLLYHIVLYITKY